MPDAQVAHERPSKEHRKLADSVDLNRNVPTLLVVRAAGCDVIRVFGATVSTTHAYVAGVASLLPASSCAWTRNTCRPAFSPRYTTLEPHAAQARPSKEHPNLLGSLELNPNCATALLVRAAGWDVMRVSGGTLSTTHAYVAGVGSALPAASTATTTSR